MTIFLQLRSGNSGPAFRGENEGDTLLWSATEQRFYVGPGGAAAGVSSFDGRTGAVVPESGDYDTDQIANVSTVTGDTLTDALDQLQSSISTLTGGSFAQLSALNGSVPNELESTIYLPPPVGAEFIGSADFVVSETYWGFEFVKPGPDDWYVLVTATLVLQGQAADAAAVALGINAYAQIFPAMNLIAVDVPQDAGAYVTVTLQRVIVCNDSSEKTIALSGQATAAADVAVVYGVMIAQVLGPV